jgi:hypothetical protein
MYPPQFIGIPSDEHTRLTGAAPTLANLHTGAGATEIFTAGTTGAAIFVLGAKSSAAGATAAGRVLFFVQKSGSTDNINRGEIVLLATTPSSSVATASGEIVFKGGLLLSPGSKLLAMKSIADSIDVYIRVGGNY